MPDAAVEELALVWSSVLELCEPFDEADWDKETACPGWTVKDQVAHLGGLEAMFLGRPQPPALPERAPHIRNDIGAANEAVVEVRRSWTGKQVLDELREISEERLAQLRQMSDEDLAKDSWTPIGPGTYRDLIRVRAFDAWVHEQDIREAVGRAGHLDGPVAENALARCLMAMPFVVGKKAAAPEGSTVVFEVTGPTQSTLAIEVSAGRARPTGEIPDDPDVRLEIGFLAFTRLGCGRADPRAALAANEVAIAGDTALGEAIVQNLAFMI
jgi:uncharacterized protein (TIGR03083 family)